METSKSLLFITLLALTISRAAAARILVEEENPIPGQQPVAGAAPVIAASAKPNGAIVATADPHHPLTFFMHDILGGSNPSARAVTGIVSNPVASGQVPFAKPNGANLPVNSGVSVNSNNNGIVNNNNVPFLTGLGGMNNAAGQNTGNNPINGGLGVAVLNGGQLPTGSTIQKFMFGTLTAIDDELTEGHELGSGLIGKAQGFYVASSVDGTSQTMAFTAMFESSGYADSISFFGVHRTGVSESHLAIMGGTGKYLNAKGYAIVKTIPTSNQTETDGFETLLQITVYLAY
ncbi:Plant disease resistance response protein [Corchorus capsularis]|uniref:Dirigent protein n=1 Tax=Corchorus capsularis TaxID=210143 RepID=A0A1R3HBE0_COCAP|nr:Plant disease resistance response protein [Corchorus capsularis]